MSIFNVFFKR